MVLSKLQQQFSVCSAKLVLYADSLGYGLTKGDSYRDPRVHGKFGEKNSYAAAFSVHKKRLADDFNLFIGRKYIQDGQHEAWAKLGEFWESLHPLARWGGRWGDANHFSFEWQGYK